MMELIPDPCHAFVTETRFLLSLFNKSEVLLVTMVDLIGLDLRPVFGAYREYMAK